jgi:TatD DNase family protein
MFIDSHAHLDMPQFEDDLPEILERARQHGVEAVVTVGTNLRQSQRATEIARSYREVYATVGIHPHDARESSLSAMDRLRKLATRPKVVALGEMGLDFYRNLSPPELQVQAFRQQIRLARDLGKPIVVHDRDAHRLVLRILQEEKAQEVGGVLHCFSGDLPMAKQCVDMGLLISIPGSITFKNSARLRNVALQLPLDRLLVETDSPFLAPIPFRGKRNEPCYIRYIADRVAKIRKIPVEDLARQLSHNTRELFGLPAPG